MIFRNCIFFITLLHLYIQCQQTGSPRQFFVPQKGHNVVYFNGSLGSIFKTKTPNIGNVHLIGSFRITNADYTRSAFDGIPEALNSLGFSTNVSAVFQILRSETSSNQLSFTIGTQQGLTTRVVPETFGLRAWYESNYYGGIIFVTPHELSFAITYLLATAPDVASFGQELDVAVAYFLSGFFNTWKPSLEISIPLGGSKGFLSQIIANPSISYLKESKWPFAVAFPLRAGAGLFGYHIPEDNFTGYISAGASVQLGIKSIAAVYGNWDLSFGLDIVYRDSKIAKISPLDKSGNLLLIGGLGINVVF